MIHLESRDVTDICGWVLACVRLQPKIENKLCDLLICHLAG